MGTLPLNVEAILNEIDTANDEWPGLSSAARIGHVHLRVSAIEDSVSFYTQVLGFDLVTRYGPSAGFVSAGGYHHHIGFNTWESGGAHPPPVESPGLNWLTVDLSNQAALDDLLLGLSRRGIVIAESPNGHMVRDPSGNDVVLRVSPS
jgi:catechol 2,3-dioxygenase